MVDRPASEERKRMKMPLPRLELRWKKDGKDWTRSICEYLLILPLGEYDIRRTKKQPNFEVLISTTKSKGSTDHSPVYNGKVHTPFRDGAHAQWDSEVLGGLPVYAVCGRFKTRITPVEKGQ
jgi:hypothetical protein